MSGNTNLQAAQRVKNDEFYTRLSDIEAELPHYREHFKGRSVYCNCDCPETSNFWRFFREHFEDYGLKRLTATYKAPDACLTILEEQRGGVALSRRTLTQGGDFRSDECIQLLRQAEIIVTNPPFSLWREYAASFYGIRPLWASEIVPSCVSVTKKFFPDMAHVGDVTRLDGAKLPPVDIITFGSPCQGLSLAGQRRGLADERSGLFLEAIRIIFEMREATHGRYPRFALFENVPGALSSAGGRDYQIVLQSFTKAEVPVPRSGKWADAGMVRGGGVDLAWCVYDAQYFGTAQRRRRLFLVADFGGKCAGEILFVPKSLRRYFEAGGTPQQGFTTFAENSVGAAGGAVEILNDQGGSSLTVERSGLSPTLRSQTHGNLPIVAGMLCMGTSQANASILSDQSPTLTCAHGQALILVHPQIAGTLCASGAGLNRPAGIKSETDLCVVKAGIPKAYSIGAYYRKTISTFLSS